MLLGGRVADAVGRNRALLVGLAGFTVASALSGAATSLGTLVTTWKYLLLRDQAVLDNPDRDFGAVADAELVSDVLDVAFGGAFADHELLADLSIGEPARDE